MITVIAGSNGFAIDEELAKRVTSFTKEYGDLAIERFDGEEADFNAMIASVQSPPFLSDRKLVVLRSPGSNDQFASAASEFISNVLQTTDLIIVERKVDKRSSYYKTLKKQSNFIDCSNVDVRDAANWLAQRAIEAGGSISNRDAQFLIDRVGLDQQLLSQEIDKLCQYNPEVTRQTIELLTESSGQSTIFQLIEAVFSGNPNKAVTLYEQQREQKIEPGAVIGMLAWQLHILAVVMTDRNGSTGTNTDKSGLNPYVIQKTKALAKHLTLGELKQIIASVLKLDMDLKTSNIDPDDAIKQLFIDIAAAYQS